MKMEKAWEKNKLVFGKIAKGCKVNNLKIHETDEIEDAKWCIC